jgi:hypothetical protein
MDMPTPCDFCDEIVDFTDLCQCEKCGLWFCEHCGIRYDGKYCNVCYEEIEKDNEEIKDEW